MTSFQSYMMLHRRLRKSRSSEVKHYPYHFFSFPVSASNWGHGDRAHPARSRRARFAAYYIYIDVPAYLSCMRNTRVFISRDAKYHSGGNHSRRSSRRALCPTAHPNNLHSACNTAPREREEGTAAPTINNPGHCSLANLPSDTS